MWYLSHSAKGTSWKSHKYLRIENGRYIYPDTLKNGAKKTLDKISKEPEDPKYAGAGKTEQEKLKSEAIKKNLSSAKGAPSAITKTVKKNKTSIKNKERPESIAKRAAKVTISNIKSGDWKKVADIGKETIKRLSSTKVKRSHSSIQKPAKKTKRRNNTVIWR